MLACPRMQSRWNDADARAATEQWGAAGALVALRVYTSRLIGQDPELVLHGGGNTSVKSEVATLLGDRVPALFVKGSGSSLDRVEPRDLPACDLAHLRRLRELPALSDEEMVNQLRTHLFDASAPNPSVEALLHAFLPHRFVDHSHADAVLALTNQPDGEARVRDALGDRVAVLPYIMPGFPLAKAVAETYEKDPRVVGVVLVKHGLFTFSEDARESYERHVELVDACERHLARVVSSRPLLTPRAILTTTSAGESGSRAARVAPILRGLLAEATDDADVPFRRVVCAWDGSPEALAFCASEQARTLARTGPLTPDHVIRTKAEPLYVETPEWESDEELRTQLADAVAAYRGDYDAWFHQTAQARRVSRTKLDSAPRVVLLPGAGAFAFGFTAKDAAIARDITRHTLRTKARAQAFGRYEALPGEDLFDMEYWSLEQAKLGKSRPRPLEGQVVLVTGGAGAIGVGIAHVCAGAGALMAIADVDPARARTAAESVEAQQGAGSAAAFAMDVTDEASVRACFDAVCLRWGGVDVVVPNAGVALVRPIAELGAAEVRRVTDVNYLGVLLAVREAARVFRMQGTGGNVVINASKNVFAPGRDFAAYSASKAAAHQLGKVAALELAPLGVRVNLVNADAVFAEGDVPSGLWAEIGPDRARSRGLTMETLPEFYRERNLLHARVTGRHVGEAVLFFASNRTPTTGATLPVDGGVAEAFPR